MNDRPICFIDCETTGLLADRRPWEIGWIRREIDGTETENVIQIVDVDLSNAELQGLHVGRFFDRWCGGFDSETGERGRSRPGPIAFEERVAAAHVMQATRGAIIVGAVPNFDTEVLAAMLRRHQLCPAWHYQLVDVETLAAGWLQARPDRAPIIAKLNARATELAEKKVLQAQFHRHASEDSPRRIEVDREVAADEQIIEDIERELSSFTAPPYRSDDLSRACGVEPPAPEERHTALGDASWVKRWYDHITEAGE
ncbi:hypothetical protein M1M07_07535 [Rhodococcus sp. HM1]|uniref:hypothetical protein n=1 Tax=Rhodococcus sp. HM1 TaxID=2937759 RepID=UPI00200A57AB|nr:hypothetical protein [Rhodococcus sp. HM1]MCK8670968.1 hypothetical protein [Rhodococcus sp. HM1]